MVPVSSLHVLVGNGVELVGWLAGCRVGMPYLVQLD